MKKLKDLVLGVALMLAGLSTIVSCSDDDKGEKAFAVPTVEGMESMEIERLSDFYTIHLNSEGAWKATCMDEWVSLSPKEGDGSQDIQIFVEDNISNEDRTALIVFESDKGDTHFTLTQTMKLDGEYPDSNDGVLDLYINRGLGKAYNIRTGEIQRRAIFNWKYLKTLVEDDEFDEDVFEYYTPSQLKDLVPTSLDSVAVRTDSLKVSATVKVTYLAFEFEVHGHYLGTTTNNYGHRVVNCNYIFPTYKGGFIDPSYLGNVYDKWMTDANKDTQNKAENIFTSTFSTHRKKIIDKKKDVAARKKAVKELDKAFGPVYLSGSTMGGEISLNLSCDSTHVADLLSAGGSIHASIKGAAWSVDVKAAADYFKKIEKLFRNLKYSFIIQGGDIKYHQTLHDAYINTGTTPTETMDAWKESVNDKNSEILDIEISGIWNLFPDDVKDLVHNDLIEIYKNQQGNVINLDNID